MGKVFLCIAAVCGFVSVAAGAFGAHALKSRLSPDMLAVFHTGAQYHLAHSLALAVVGLALAHWPHVAFAISGWCFVAGMVLFSGSLYALALSGVRVLGAITPLGGIGFLLGWACLGWGAFRAL